MSRASFIAFVEDEVSLGVITDDQLESILQKVHQEHRLTPTQAVDALKDEGFVADDGVNYFEKLNLTIESLENQQNEKAMKQCVTDAFLPPYNRALSRHNAEGTREQNLLIRAKNILTDPKKRKRHIDWLSRGIIFRFPNGEEATSIPELATLMKKHTKEGTDALYQGDIARNLDRVGESHFARTAQAVVSEFSRDRNTGSMAMVAIFLDKVRMQNGNAAGTPQQLARLIDQNWDEAKTLLYNGFFAFWLKYTNQRQFASTAENITRNNRLRTDIGLEEFVQKLDPRIGHPKLETSQSQIDFGRMHTESEKTIRFEIKNIGRGFLYGDVQLESSMSGLQISDAEIQGNGIVTVKLDASDLTVKQMHQASLLVNTNGGNLKVPISCSIDYPIRQSVQRVAISGFSVAAIALVTRLILQQFGISEWLTSFIDWEHHWNWVVWFEWPWFDWRVYTLAAPKEGVGFVIALASLGVGVFAYWFFVFKGKGVP